MAVLREAPSPVAALDAEALASLVTDGLAMVVGTGSSRTARLP
jgi:hypothetical protein